MIHPSLPIAALLSLSLSLALTLNASAEGASSQATTKTKRTQNERRRKNTTSTATTHRKDLSTETSDKSSDDMDDDSTPSVNVNVNGANDATPSTPTREQSEFCSPVSECEMCPHNWKVLIEKEDEKIKGELESCTMHGRRRKFECSILFKETESSEKLARSSFEYRPCRYTEADEQYRMVRMQMICLLIGVWSMRNVCRQRVVSASLFDQRRMRIQSSNGSVSSTNMRRFSALQKKNTTETVELIQTTSAAKVPKSPAPDPNLQTV
ncbi:hypothetical protein ACHAWF_016939 [Thalassiosira exigua]